jgi:hypothetical protein
VIVDSFQAILQAYVSVLELSIEPGIQIDGAILQASDSSSSTALLLLRTLFNS